MLLWEVVPNRLSTEAASVIVNLEIFRLNLINVILFITLYEMVLTFKSVHETL